MHRLGFLTLLIALVLLHLSLGLEMNDMEGSNFEAVLASNKYAAILFYGNSAASQLYKDVWMNAASLISTNSRSTNTDVLSLHSESEMTMVDGTDSKLQEIIEAYGIELPSIKIFRRGILNDYRGPHFTQEALQDKEAFEREIAAYVSSDSKPSITTLDDVVLVKNTLTRDHDHAIVLGFFDSHDIKEEDDPEEGYSMSPWGQFQACADSLRSHATFYHIHSPDVMEAFGIDSSTTPAIFLLNDDKNSMVPYNGDIIEVSLTEWILRSAIPKMGQLHLHNSAGEVYATQFFSSRRLKFIFIVPSLAPIYTEMIGAWKEVSEKFKGKAIFAYMIADKIPDVMEYFGINDKDAPVIVAHDPTQDAKYMTEASVFSAFGEDEDGDDNSNVESGASAFVDDVVRGRKNRILRSESLSTSAYENDAGVSSDGIFTNGVIVGDDWISQGYHSIINYLTAARTTTLGQKEKRALPIKVVGSNVVTAVSNPGTDVLLLIHKGKYFANRADYEFLARAVAAENRIQCLYLNKDLNDIPSHWEAMIESKYPALLFFPAKDKPYQSSSSPTDDDNEEEKENLTGRDRKNTKNQKQQQQMTKPRPYWDTEKALPDMMSFLQRTGSFEARDLKIATQDQLGMLMSDLQGVALAYSEEERIYKRNNARLVYEDTWADYLMGEIVYDGKRWHILLVILYIVSSLLSPLFTTEMLDQIGLGFLKNLLMTTNSTKKTTVKKIIRKTKKVSSDSDSSSDSDLDGNHDKKKKKQ